MSDEEYGYEDDNGGGYDDDDGGNNDDGYEPEEDNGQEYDQQNDYQAEEYYDDDEAPTEEEEQQEGDEPQEEEEDQEQQEEANDTNEESYDYHNDPTLEEEEAPPATANTNFAEGDNDGGHIPIDFRNMVKGALDGFGGGSIGDIMGTIENITGGSGGLTNIMASGGLAVLATNLIANAAHQFLNINPDTGRIIGSIAGNLIFNMGGQHNSLSDIGKIVLDNIISGKFHRDVVPFVSPHPGMPSFNLNFQAERDRCLREQRLFEDPEFPAQDSSLYYSKRPKQQIEWLRPAQIINDPQLIVSGQSRFDVIQGAIGNCWLLAAAANLTLRDELFYRVVPPDQSFVENYAGIFHFQFWRYGQWVDVVIDDRLPTSNGKLIYMHSDSENEFWSALLEKAYAKLYGSYEALKGGSTAEALEDFTGGLIEYFEVKEVSKEQLLAVLVRGFQMGSLFGCSIDADPNVTEARMESGLVRGHAYSVTALQTVQGPHGETLLLRIRNPWGNEQEWNGAWSDNSREWQFVSPEELHKMEFVRKDDGEFWISFDDFYAEFEQLENCNLGPEVMNEIAAMTGVDAAREATAWTSFSTNGGWNSQQGSSGGCRNYIDTFPNNPQYGTYLSLTNGTVENDGKCTVITAVLQKYRRELRTQGLESLAIGFAVYELERSHSLGRQDRSFFEQSKPVAKNPTFINLREVTARFRLPPGNYIIVPSTYSPNEDAEFLLRVYCSGEIKAQQV